MGVLAAVLAHAGHVALDVAGILRARVEGRREQQDQAVVRPHQMLLERPHRRARAARVAHARDHRPGLGDRVDRALVVRRRAERRPVVEVGATVPGAVPGLLVRHLDRVGALSRGTAPPARRPRAARRSGRSGSARPRGTRPPRRSRRARPRRHDSSRRSSRRCRSAAGRAALRSCRGRAPAGSARTAWRAWRTRPGRRTPRARPAPAGATR